ncbi:hypothetical protein [Streptomyces griseocarneus]|uniref:hypothetical protein n=1 Tax=Streptomyces griseocarneus TaxID=51201 RepID=UPI00167E7EBB|nr:hypothetical protein [Streptomyces griseocarneus]MBZ6476563.1 hypothetical protein [Streptomyces griseocarneus]GHG79696.1 hypothetical protein GCM10018779_60660 [Streptomyces griseocarneus]
MRGGRFVGAAVALSALATGTAEAADGPAAYRMASGATAVTGSGSSGDGPLLKAGASTYTDSIRPGEKKYYSVELDGQSSAFVSAVAVPRPGGSMGLRDGIEVALQAPDGTPCGSGRNRSFLSAGGAYPVADYAERVVRAGGPCASAGTYRFVVQRGDATGGDDAAVPVELKYVAEAPRKNETDAPPAPGGWSSRAPSGPPLGEGEGVTGGTGFNDAAELRSGVWKDELRPGETRFYRVSVDAGEQLFADAEFGPTPDAGPYVVRGVRLGLSNSARGYVMNRTGGYQGKPATVSLATPPAAYGDAGAGGEAARGMHFAGWYYLQVSLSPKVRRDARDARGRGVPVTLKVEVAGARKAGHEEDIGRGGAVGGELVAAAGGGPRNGRLRIIGYAGIGTGSALLLGLGAWTLAARRRDG